MRAAWWSAWGLGIGLSLLAPAKASAETPRGTSYPSCVGRTVSPAESDAAHKIYLAGRVQYDDSNWDAAISQFREAYRRDCTKPELLIILSRAYEAKGDRPEAVAALQAYFARVPADSPDATALRSRLANIQKQIAKDEEKARASQPPTTPPPAADGAPSGTTKPVVTATWDAPRSSEPRPSRGHTALPWVVTGLGVATVATGIVLLVTAPDMPPNCNQDTGKCTFQDPSKTQDTASKAELAQNEKDSEQANKAVSTNVAGTITTIAGGALLVGGLAWHFLEPTGPVDADRAQTKTLTVSPSVGLHSAGVSLGGTF